MTMSTIDELRQSLEDLSRPAKAQVVLFPDWIVPGDELRRAFSAALEKHRASNAPLSAAQDSSLSALAAYITELSGPWDRGLWENPSVLGRDSRWENIRELAQRALAALAGPA